MIQREHIAQKHARLFAREAVDAEHEFAAFDRAPALRNPLVAHMRQKAIGVRKDWPDTLLRVQGMANIWCEWKAPGETPTPGQFAMGRRLQELGDEWFWCQTVECYRLNLRTRNVPLRANATFLAQLHDASVASEIAKAELKAGKVPKTAKPRARRATQGQIASWHAAGGWRP